MKTHKNNNYHRGEKGQQKEAKDSIDNLGAFFVIKGD